MRYLPHTDRDVARMLERIGATTIEDLFASIPEESRVSGSLDLPPALDEGALKEHILGLAARNERLGASPSFLGCGAYDHVVPAAVDAVISRGEFFTAYTPYQPEVSQGTLQALFEFQTMTAELFGLDVANASMYDGASATAEAVLMARRIQRRRSKVLVSDGVHPEYRQTIDTYLSGIADLEVVRVPLSAQGTTDLEVLSRYLDDDTVCVVAQSPNLLGLVEDWRALAELAASHKALTVGVVGELTSLGIYEAPGRLGADIVVGDGLGLCGPLTAGGPGVGLLACRDAYKRSLPGRLVGWTTDTEGREGYVLTLAAREQHIRREKATSNICTNHSLMALALSVHLALLGRVGFRRLSRINYSNAAYLHERLGRAGLLAYPEGAFYNELAVKVSGPASDVARRISAQEGIRPGVGLDRFGESASGLEDVLLVCTTERHKKEDLDRLVQALERHAR